MKNKAINNAGEEKKSLYKKRYTIVVYHLAQHGTRMT